MRINKFLAECGLGSRRSCESLITEGKVRLNGKTAGLGEDVDPERDVVTVSGRRVTPPRKYTYLMFHKPKGCVTTASDDLGRRTVMDYIDLTHVRVYPVGRLDYDSEGLLLLTNDGDLTERMLHPSREVEKVYLARVSNQVTSEEARRLENGVMVDGRRTARAKVKLLSVKPLYTDMLVTIHEGRNRQVRKMVEQVGHQVVLLRRIRFGPLRLGDLPRGMWRELTPEELATLKAL